MTRLEELKASYVAAYAAAYAADEVADEAAKAARDAHTAAWAVYTAYEDELKKQEEETND